MSVFWVFVYSAIMLVKAQYSGGGGGGCWNSCQGQSWWQQSYGNRSYPTPSTSCDPQQPCNSFSYAYKYQSVFAVASYGTSCFVLDYNQNSWSSDADQCIGGASNWFTPDMAYGRAATFSSMAMFDYLMQEIKDMTTVLNIPMPSLLWLGATASRGGRLLSDYCWLTADKPMEAGAQVSSQNTTVTLTGSAAPYCLAVNVSQPSSFYGVPCSGGKNIMLCEFGCENSSATCYDSRSPNANNCPLTSGSCDIMLAPTTTTSTTSTSTSTASITPLSSSTSTSTSAPTSTPSSTSVSSTTTSASTLTPTASSTSVSSSTSTSLSPRISTSSATTTSALSTPPLSSSSNVLSSSTSTLSVTRTSSSFLTSTSTHISTLSSTVMASSTPMSQSVSVSYLALKPSSVVLPMSSSNIFSTVAVPTFPITTFRPSTTAMSSSIMLSSSTETPTTGIVTTMPPATTVTTSMPTMANSFPKYSTSSINTITTAKLSLLSTSVSTTATPTTSTTGTSSYTSTSSSSTSASSNLPTTIMSTASLPVTPIHFSKSPTGPVSTSRIVQSTTAFLSSMAGLTTRFSKTFSTSTLDSKDLSTASSFPVGRSSPSGKTTSDASASITSSASTANVPFVSSHSSSILWRTSSQSIFDASGTTGAVALSSVGSITTTGVPSSTTTPTMVMPQTISRSTTSASSSSTTSSNTIVDSISVTPTSFSAILSSQPLLSSSSSDSSSSARTNEFSTSIILSTPSATISMGASMSGPVSSTSMNTAAATFPDTSTDSFIDQSRYQTDALDASIFPLLWTTTSLPPRLESSTAAGSIATSLLPLFPTTSMSTSENMDTNLLTTSHTATSNEAPSSTIPVQEFTTDEYSSLLSLTPTISKQWFETLVYSSKQGGFVPTLTPTINRGTLKGISPALSEVTVAADTIIAPQSVGGGPPAVWTTAAAGPPALTRGRFSNTEAVTTTTSDANSLALKRQSNPESTVDKVMASSTTDMWGTQLAIKASTFSQTDADTIEAETSMVSSIASPSASPYTLRSSANNVYIDAAQSLPLPISPVAVASKQSVLKATPTSTSDQEPSFFNSFESTSLLVDSTTWPSSALEDDKSEITTHSIVETTDISVSSDATLLESAVSPRRIHGEVVADSLRIPITVTPNLAATTITHNNLDSTAVPTPTTHTGAGLSPSSELLVPFPTVTALSANVPKEITKLSAVIFSPTLISNAVPTDNPLPISKAAPDVPGSSATLKIGNQSVAIQSATNAAVIYPRLIESITETSSQPIIYTSPVQMPNITPPLDAISLTRNVSDQPKVSLDTLVSQKPTKLVPVRVPMAEIATQSIVTDQDISRTAIPKHTSSIYEIRAPVIHATSHLPPAVAPILATATVGTVETDIRSVAQTSNNQVLSPTHNQMEIPRVGAAATTDLLIAQTSPPQISADPLSAEDIKGIGFLKITTSPAVRKDTPGQKIFTSVSPVLSAIDLPVSSTVPSSHIQNKISDWLPNAQSANVAMAETGPLKVARSNPPVTTNNSEMTWPTPAGYQPVFNEAPSAERLTIESTQQFLPTDEGGKIKSLKTKPLMSDFSDSSNASVKYASPPEHVQTQSFPANAVRHDMVIVPSVTLPDEENPKWEEVPDFSCPATRTSQSVDFVTLLAQPNSVNTLNVLSELPSVTERSEPSNVAISPKIEPDHQTSVQQLSPPLPEPTQIFNVISTKAITAFSSGFLPDITAPTISPYARSESAASQFTDSASFMKDTPTQSPSSYTHPPSGTSEYTAVGNFTRSSGWWTSTSSRMGSENTDICEAAEWEPYSPCSAICGNAVKMRHRKRTAFIDQSIVCPNETATCDTPKCNPMPELHQVVSYVMMNIGCMWILVSLGLSVLFYAGIRHHYYLQIIHLNQDISLFVAHLLVLILSVRNDQRFSHDVCKIAALGLQYFFCVTFILQGIEALHIYTVLTDVVTGDNAFVSIRRALAIAWGFPAVITVTTGATAYHRLMSDFSCWVNLGDMVLVGTFLPVAAVAWPTVILLEATGFGNTNRKSQEVTSCRVAQGGLYFVFGAQFTSWFMSVTAIYYQHVSLFAIVFGFNASLGIFIYMYHLFSNKKVRVATWNAWRRVRSLCL